MAIKHIYCSHEMTSRPIVVQLSRGHSVGLYRTCVRPSVCPVHCGKNGGSDPDAVWRHRSGGSRDEAGIGVCQSVHGKRYFWGEFGAHYCNQWRLYGVRVRQCLNRRSCGLGWCVRWAKALLYYMGSTSCKGKGVLRVFCSPFSQWEMPLDGRR